MAIEKITSEERGTLPLVPMGKKHPVRAAIEMMQPGDNIRISRADFLWRARKTPNMFCKKLQEQGKGKFRIWQEINRTAWVVERVE